MATMDKKLSLGWPSGGHAADNDRFTGHKPAPLTTPVDEYTMRRLHPTAVHGVLVRRCRCTAGRRWISKSVVASPVESKRLFRCQSLSSLNVSGTRFFPKLKRHPSTTAPRCPRKLTAKMASAGRPRRPETAPMGSNP